MDCDCFFLFLAAMVFLRVQVWMSVRRVFASGVGFVCLCPGVCVGVAGGGWCECVSRLGLEVGGGEDTAG